MANGEQAFHPVAQLQYETQFRIFLILILQVGGALAVFISHLAYAEPLPHDTLVWIINFGGLLTGATFAGACYFAVLMGVPPWAARFFRVNYNPVETNELISAACACLMVIDAIFAEILVLSTGGLLSSMFSPLLLAVVGIAFTFRLPRPTLIKTFISIVAVATLGGLIYMHAETLWWNPHSGPGNYRAALILNIIFSTILTVMGGFEVLLNRVPLHLVSRTCDRLTAFVGNRADHRVAISRGMRKFSWDVSRRTTSATLSEVHDLQTVVEQAVILNLPYNGISLADTRAAIVYMTFASHWADDFFDHLYDDINELNYMYCEAGEVFASSRHLSRLRRDIRRRFSVQSTRVDRAIHWLETRFFVHNSGTLPSTRGAIIDRGLMRIFLSGVLQRFPDEGGVGLVVSRCVQQIIRPEQLHRNIAEVYRNLESKQEGWIIIWGSAKAVMELFDVCSPGFDLTCSEIYSLLFTPLMVFQNIKDEATKEEMSNAFITSILGVAPSSTNTKTPVLNSKAISERLLPCLTIFRDNASLLDTESDTIRRDRRSQLAATMTIYGDQLTPALRKAYYQLLDDAPLWSNGGDSPATVQSDSGLPSKAPRS